MLRLPGHRRRGRGRTPRQGEPGPADAVVVLGAQVLGPDDPSPAVRRRLDGGLRALAAHGVKWLVLAGGVGESGVSEASVMAGLARRQGVPPGRLVLEECSHSTLDQAVAVSRLAGRRGWNRVLVVSDRYHLPRALFLFRHMGLEAAGYPVRGPGGAPRGRWLGGWVREAGAWGKVAVQALDGTLGRARLRARSGGADEFRGSCG